MHARSATDINQHYRTLRPQLLMYMVIGYAAFYLTRKSVNYVLPALQTDLGLDKGDIGLLGSLRVEVYRRAVARQPRAALVYGRWPVRYRPAERGVRLWRVADAAAGGLVAERIFPGLGMAPLRPPADPLVFAQRTRFLVGVLEYVDQYRWGDYPPD